MLTSMLTVHVSPVVVTTGVVIMNWVRACVEDAIDSYNVEDFSFDSFS